MKQWLPGEAQEAWKDKVSQRQPSLPRGRSQSRRGGGRWLEESIARIRLGRREPHLYIYILVAWIPGFRRGRWIRWGGRFLTRTRRFCTRTRVRRRTRDGIRLRAGGAKVSWRHSWMMVLVGLGAVWLVREIRWVGVR